MDALNDPGIHTVVVMSSAQVGKTELLLNTIGYYVDQDPAPMLLIQPTLDMAEAFSKDRVAPMVRDTPALTKKIADPKSKSSGNTLLHKKFAGGHLTMAGANSPASLASRPVRVVLCDEVDRYPLSAGTEGDPVSLARKRSATFWNRKMVLTSTPTVKDVSRIELAYEQSSKCRFYLPCPSCGHDQPLWWRQIKFYDGDPQTARYECESCGESIDEGKKAQMLLSGRWIAENPDARGVAGFHLNELYSPWRKWSEVVDDFLRAKNSPELLKTWVNTSLGEAWEEAGETVEPSSILTRREVYAADCPEGVKLLTAGVDVQQDRLELYVLGFGAGEECWFIDQMALYGLTDQGDVWQQLDQALQASYSHESGASLNISATLIDSGFNTNHVYDFCRTRAAGRVFAIKGMPGEGKPLVGRRTQYQIPGSRRKGWLYPLGVDSGKVLLYLRLQNGTPGPGYMHVPSNRALFNEEFAEQLTAEKMVTRHKKGFPVREWEKIRPRNEALDCTVYALAALRLIPRYESMLMQDIPKQKPQQAAKPTQQAQQVNDWLGAGGNWL